MANPNDPAKKLLSREQKDAIKKAQRILHDLVPMIAAAEQCGFDCEREKRLHQNLVDQMRRIDTFFVGRTA